jgi:hypothetical protein
MGFSDIFRVDVHGHLWLRLLLRKGGTTVMNHSFQCLRDKFLRRAGLADGRIAKLVKKPTRTNITMVHRKV